MSEKIGRFEYVKRGLVGVCAATMLAGMCAVPAFADPTVEQGTQSPIASGGDASTAVNVEAADTQISATVPTSVTATVDSKGEMIFPSVDNFTIKATNTSWPVKVSALEVTPGSGYSLVDGVADLTKSKDLYLAIGGKSITAADNATAIGDLKQAAANGDPITIEMSGGMYKPAFSDIDSKVAAATLKWTLSVF